MQIGIEAIQYRFVILGKVEIKMHLKRLLFLFLISLLGQSCETDPNFSIPDIVESYYQVYEERTDIQALSNYYADQFVLEDIMLGLRVSEKRSLVSFFDWANPDFKKSEDQLFVITNQIIADRQVVTEGYFKSFSWSDTQFGPMYFTTILTFNDQGKIIKHTDWINYPSNLLDYNNRENSNEWIPQ